MLKYARGVNRVMDGVRVGICSWTDRGLIKSGFYPASASTPASRLAYYSTQFDIVEVDSSYYSLLGIGNAYRWIAGSPANFTFGVKSFSLFPFHRAQFSSLPAWLKGELGERKPASLVRRGDLSHEQRVRLFGDFIEPVRILHASRRLSYLLFQFPPGWRFSREGLIYFKRLREMAGPLPVAVEVRNNSWFEAGCREKFLSVLSDQNIAYVAVDEPKLAWTAPDEWPITAEWGTIVRFHGRNAGGWSNPRATVRERFNYRYSESELSDWARRAEKTAGMMNGPKGVLLMFNNCVEDYAVDGARRIASMLGIGGGVLPRAEQTTLGFEE
jgi:uncharacterized protein YecE (DUF72 family)